LKINRVCQPIIIERKETIPLHNVKSKTLRDILLINFHYLLWTRKLL